MGFSWSIMGIHSKCSRWHAEYWVWETYFPDQPVKLSLKSLSGNTVLYELESNNHLKVVLPQSELIETLLNGADEFFQCMETYFKGKCNYQYEINKIASLRTLYPTFNQ